MPSYTAKIELHASVGFPSWDYNADPFQADDFTANFIVRAIKRDETRLKGRWMRLQGKRITLENYREIHTVWQRWASQRITQLVQNPVLVPIPNSGAVPAAQTYATLELAQGISAASGANWPVYSGLRFTEVMTPSSKGGERSKEVLAGKMTALAPIQPGTPVLIDDVCTLGGHLFAAQRALELWKEPLHAVVCGRTVKARLPAMLRNIDETLQDTWYW